MVYQLESPDITTIIDYCEDLLMRIYPVLDVISLMHLPKVRKKRTWKNCDRKWMRNKEKI